MHTAVICIDVQNNFAHLADISTDTASAWKVLATVWRRSSGLMVPTIPIATCCCVREGVKTTIQPGTTTEGYVEDAIASPNPVLHEGSMNLFRNQFSLANAPDILAIWSPSKARPLGAQGAA